MLTTKPDVAAVALAGSSDDARDAHVTALLQPGHNMRADKKHSDQQKTTRDGFDGGQCGGMLEEHLGAFRLARRDV